MRMGMSYEEAVILAELRDRFLKAVSESYPYSVSSDNEQEQDDDQDYTDENDH